ncbi:MAG TPA: ABC transporter permease [Longimicrobiales bacterium]|nr:ABC transporter permease [Longimicrobiales bacterium]
MKAWRRFRGPLGRDPRRDVEEELTFHLEMRIRQLIEEGETPERARELTVRRFGNVAAARDECFAINDRQERRMAKSEYISELRQDIAYALRSLRRRPGFTVGAVLTLALGIGANSAIFSVVNGVLLRPLPFAHAERLYQVQMIYPDGQRYTALSAPDFMSVGEMNRVFEEFGAYADMQAPLRGLGEPKEVLAAIVSDGLLDMLGMRLALGRGFRSEEHQAGRDNVAVLDHGFWQREFGGSGGALGQSVTFNGTTYTVVGVLAPESALPTRMDVYFPMPYDETFSATAVAGRRSEFLMTLGRARAGLTEEQIAADIAGVSSQLAADFPLTNERLAMGVRSAREAIIGDVRRPLFVLLGAVGFVLLVACANVANLLLARASARQSELSVRAALGAGRARLVRQMLTESVVLGALGGAAGLALAWAGTRALVRAQPADIPRLESVGVDGTVVLVTLAVALLTGVLFGILPALQATRSELGRTIREGSRGLSGTGQRVRSGLIVVEMALAVVLLVGAGLLIRSFIELTRVDPGFHPERAVAFRISMDEAGYAGGQQIRDFVSTLIDRMDAMPGVSSAGGTGVLPLQGRSSILNFAVEGALPPPENVNMEIGISGATPGYFETIGARVLRGRGFDERDHSDAPDVALINQTGAEFWFPGEDPIGRRVEVGADMREIVGIVSDVLQGNPATPVMPHLYAPYAQRTTRNLQIVASTDGDPLALAPTLRSLVRSMDPTMPISEFTPLVKVVSESMARPRFYTSLLALFAGLALVLAAVGIFGVMSYSVTQRAREISIRMALGARRGNVIRMIVGRSMVLAAVGLIVGMAGAAALATIIRSQLYNVKPMDPLTLGAVVVVLAATAFAASYLPARRAASLDPGAALRET